MPSLKLEYKWLVGMVFVIALFMDLLDITVTNVAIPTLASEFGDDYDDRVGDHWLPA